MYAFDGATGAWLWEFLAPGSSVAAPAIVNGSVYWGNGYSRFGTPNSALYAFSAPGR
jgi:polyvinyl alcohol dehydrogenase (cytochrome)